MARERMVTRTITATEYTVLCLDVTKCNVSRETLTLTGEALSTEKALKALKKKYETVELKLVTIEATNSVEEIYGMLETDFIKYATKMTADRHFIETEGEENND